MTDDLTYDVVGLTCPGDEEWSVFPAGYRRYAVTVRIGEGERCWNDAASAVLDWRIKTRSGFVVTPLTHGLRVREGADYELTARPGLMTVRERVRVISVVERPACCGFAYGTLPGHPVSGEEAFIVHREADGEVRLTLRSLTRPGRGCWRWAFPVLLLAQKHYRRRYQRALRATC